MKKNIAQTDATRQKLKKSFWTLYTQKDFNTITVKQITDLAGCNRGTFYVYFKDSPDILDCIEDDILTMLSKNYSIVLNAFKQNGPVMETMSLLTRFYERYQDLLRVMIGEKANPSFIRKLKIMVADNILSHIVVREDACEDVRCVVEFMVSAQIGLVTYWFQNRQGQSPERLTELSYRLMNGGSITVLKEFEVKE